MTQREVRGHEIEDEEELLAVVWVVRQEQLGEEAFTSVIESAVDREYDELEVRMMIQGLRQQADLLEGRLLMELDLKELGLEP